MPRRVEIMECIEEMDEWVRENMSDFENNR